MATARPKPAAKSKATLPQAKPAKAPKPKGKATFNADEREAMRERAREARSSGTAVDGEADVLAKIAAMKPADREIAECLHQLIRRVAPTLVPKTWYGMPAYALNGKTLCFFQAAARFKTRYATFGFSDAARLDDGGVWPTAFAVMRWNDVTERRIRDLLQKAMVGPAPASHPSQH